MKIPTFDEIIRKCEDIMSDFYKRYSGRLKEELEDGWSVELFSSDRMVIVNSDAVADEEESYLCDGSGTPYAEYILRQHYKPNLTEQECKELACDVVVQISKIDPNVGGPVNLCVIKESGLEHISRQKIDEIVENITEIPAEQQLKIQSIVEEIVEGRRWINDLFKAKIQDESLQTGRVRDFADSKNLQKRKRLHQQDSSTCTTSGSHGSTRS